MSSPLLRLSIDPIGVGFDRDAAWTPLSLNLPLRSSCVGELLRRILAADAGYYNEVRTHLALGKHAPRRRPIHRLRAIAVRPILGGLHHEYCRM